MSSQPRQQSLIGSPSGDRARIQTEGRVIRPFTALVNATVDEARLWFTDGGLSITAVDSANVALVDIDLPASAFDEYDLDAEVVAGWNIDTIRSHLSDARMGKRTSDPVELVVDASHTRVSIEREYADTTVEQTTEQLTIDPDAIREDPDNPELEYDCEVTVDRQAFTDTIDHVGSITDHVKLTVRDEQLVASAARTDNDSEPVEAAEAVFDTPVSYLGDDPHSEPTSVFTGGYIEDFADGLVAGKIDEVTLRWGDELPLKVVFERHSDDGLVYEGEYMMAPRIVNGGDEQ